MEGPDDCGGLPDGFCPEGGLEGDWAGGRAGGRDGPAVPGMQPGVPPMVIGMPIYGSRIKIKLLSKQDSVYNMRKEEKRCLFADRSLQTAVCTTLFTGSETKTS